MRSNQNAALALSLMNGAYKNGTMERAPLIERCFRLIRPEWQDSSTTTELFQLNNQVIICKRNDLRFQGRLY